MTSDKSSNVGIATKPKSHQDAVKSFALKKDQDVHRLNMCRGYFPMILTSIAFVFILVLISLFCAGKIPLPNSVIHQIVIGAGSVFGSTKLSKFIWKYFSADRQ